MLRERSHIAQFDTPEAILTNPPDDFVSGFVGAGAALKRLNLTRVRDVGDRRLPHATGRRPAAVDLRPAALRLAQRTADAGPQRPPVQVAAPRRPDAGQGIAGAGRARWCSDTVTRDATLRDALEAVLTDSAGRVAVTGRRGEYIGVVDMETLMNSVQELLEADHLEAIEHQHQLEEQRARQTQQEQEGVAARRRAARASRHEPPARARPRQPAAPERPRALAFRDESRGAGARAGERPPVAPSGRRRISWQKWTSCRSSSWPRCSPPSCGSAAPAGLHRGELAGRRQGVELRWWQHIQLTAISTFFVLIIAIPLGIALTRPSCAGPPRSPWPWPTSGRPSRPWVCWSCWSSGWASGPFGDRRHGHLRRAAGARQHHRRAARRSTRR